MTASSPFLFEATAENFVNEVIERSHQVPVVVDFWAEWCQPCRMLGPVLERLAIEYDGKFILAKANTEQMPELASGFGVRSIPAVFGIKGGKVVDSFVGVLPEAAVRAWLDGIMPTPAEILLAEAAKLEPTDPRLPGRSIARPWRWHRPTPGEDRPGPGGPGAGTARGSPIRCGSTWSVAGFSNPRPRP